MLLNHDEGTRKLFEQVSDQLQQRYSRDEAEKLIEEYCSKFSDLDFCRSIGVPVQDDDFFHHEGAGGMALRIHYYLGLKLDPDPHAFIKWRSKFLKRA